jgi:hypothetical protein
MGVNTTRSLFPMSRYARTAPGQTLEIIPTRRPFSFFNFVETRFKDILKKMLPDERIWMVELSVPELFSANLRKVGEVLLRAEVSPSADRDLASFVMVRLPGYFALYAGGSAANPRYHFIPSGAEGHVELFGCENARSAG